MAEYIKESMPQDSTPAGEAGKREKKMEKEQDEMVGIHDIEAERAF